MIEVQDISLQQKFIIHLYDRNTIHFCMAKYSALLFDRSTWYYCMTEDHYISVSQKCKSFLHDRSAYYFLYDRSKGYVCLTDVYNISVEM